MKFQDLTGKRFERWTVLNRGTPHPKRTLWVCKCSCGTVREVVADSLTRGASTSCGCLHRELVAQRFTTHGKSDTPEFIIWAHIVSRCTNPNDTAFKNYGGRGIRICAEWKKDFAAFLKHVGPRPSPAHSIERIRNSRGYAPGNVRWATWREQCRNKRTNVFLSFSGKRMCLADWAEKQRIPYHRLKRRILDGWSIARSLTTP